MSGHFIKYLLGLLFVLIISSVGPPTFAEPIRGFDFPKRIGQFNLGSIVNFERAKPGLGYGLPYNAPGVKATVYVYNNGISNLPTGIDSRIVKHQFNSACGDIEKVNSDAQRYRADERFTVAGIPLLHAVYMYTEVKPGIRKPVLSHLYFSSLKGNFIKIRITYSPDETPNGERLQVQFVESLCKILAK